MNHVANTKNVLTIKIPKIFNVGISIAYVGPRNTQIYDKEHAPRTSQTNASSSTKTKFHPKPFHRVKDMCILDHNSKFLEVRGPKNGSGHLVA